MNLFPLLTLKCFPSLPQKAFLNSFFCVPSAVTELHKERKSTVSGLGRERQRQRRRVRERESETEVSLSPPVPAGIGSHEPGLDITSQWRNCPECSLSLQTGSVVFCHPSSCLLSHVFCFIVFLVHTHV